jgi:5-methylcytosine-specific restriction endonuclease McrA
MGNRVYLVDLTSAQAARDRQLAEADKRRRREWKLEQIRQLQKDLPKLPKKKKAKKPKAKPYYARVELPYKPGMGKQFYDTREWHIVRYKAIKTYGKTCQCCGAKDVEIHVDHIKPRSKHPELELEITNLQILCRQCNLGKGNTDSIDWRTSGTIAQSAKA